MDVNPFTPFGIEVDQIRFFDLFLVWCLLRRPPCSRMTKVAATATARTKVVLEGVAPA